tara:strand:+ start:324 stop:950 length:627 start_codon:yes stop_codon:yes gene_type:complete
MVMDLLWIVVKIAGSLLSTVCAFRAYLKFINLHPYSPLFQVVKNCTDWIVQPLAKIFPDSNKYDWGSISGAILISFFVAIFFYFTKTLQNIDARVINGFPEFIQPFGFVLILGIVWLLDWCLHLTVILIIVHVVLSWISPATKIGAMRPIVERLVSPLLLPLQKIIFRGTPKFSELNFDPSPIALFVILQILFLVNDRVIVELISSIL